MNRITKFFHELMNPHCPDCQEQRDIEFERARESNRDQVYELLERQLANANETIRILTERLTNPQPTAVVTTSEASPKPLRTRPLPFSVIRQHLEQESRAKLQAMKDAAQPDSQISQNNEPKDNVTPSTTEIMKTEELESLILESKVAGSNGTKQS